MKVLETSHVTFAYDDGTTALKDLTISVDEGEKVAILGPNGAGKSTLLHLLAGFRMPFEGKVLICGKRLEQANADMVRRDLGLLFQDPDDQLFMPTVEEDVAFGPKTLKLDDIEGRVKRGLRSTGTEHLSKRRPHRLSHGMKKRAAIAGILAMDPRVLLLDEPTSGLDPKSRSELVELLRSMDRTMLIATHDLESAAEIVDRAIVLNAGVIKEGTIRDIVTDSRIMDEAGLELPPVSKVFRRIASMGYPVEDIPVSVDRAVTELTRVVETEMRRARAEETAKPAFRARKT